MGMFCIPIMVINPLAAGSKESVTTVVLYNIRLIHYTILLLRNYAYRFIGLIITLDNSDFDNCCMTTNRWEWFLLVECSRLTSLRN